MHPQTSTHHHHEAVEPPDPRRWWALTVLAVAQFMLILDITIVTVALPDIGRDLTLSRSATTWVSIAYTLLFGGLLVFGGRCADLFGARRMVLTGLTVFTGSSLLAGLAMNAPMLLGGRVGQGIGAALLSPAAMAILTTTFHGAERNKALGVWGALGGVGAAAGFVAGGLLTAGPGWSWIFFVNVPVGVVLAALMTKVVSHRPAQPGHRIDALGAILVTATIGAAIYGLINAGDDGWTDPRTLISLLAAVVLGAGYLRYGLGTVAPLFDPRMLSRRPVAAGALLMLVATGLLISGFFISSFYLQQTQGKSALATGLLFVPIALGTLVGAHNAGHFIGHFGYRPVAVAGLLSAATGAAVPAIWPGTTALIVGLSIAAAGQGAVMVTATTTALAEIEHSRAGVTSGLVNTFHELGAALGVAVFSTVAAVSIRSLGADTSGFDSAFLLSAGIAGVAALAALALVPSGKPPAGIRVSAH
ncbi:MFS transporter [Nocardia cyriacigeorgica]|uniref:Spectinomycin tetracycline efflux pump n=1 Tax=Nocardia cyriacigeorgica TaxID=135487 RepID=A0A4U8VVU2_9NOCA|nr:MFS transporter [Nocardia cyriacigeorgica]VFA97790.1 Spectinomycin tetracycline efflux pump [Nocardia cyriacigeorgica]